MRPKRDSSSTVARGAAQSSRSASSSPWCKERSAGSGLRPSKSTMISNVAASIARYAPADGAQDGGGHGASHVASFEEPPQGVAGHAEVLGCLAPSVQPTRRRARTLGPTLCEILVRPASHRLVFAFVALRQPIDCSSSAMGQYLIVNKKHGEGNALQGIVLGGGVCGRGRGPSARSPRSLNVCCRRGRSSWPRSR